MQLVWIGDCEISTTVSIATIDSGYYYKKYNNLSSCICLFFIEINQRKIEWELNVRAKKWKTSREPEWLRQTHKLEIICQLDLLF